MGLVYTDLTHLGFVVLSLQLGMNIEEYLVEEALLELELVFVFQCSIRVY